MNALPCPVTSCNKFHIMNGHTHTGLTGRVCSVLLETAHSCQLDTSSHHLLISLKSYFFLRPRRPPWICWCWLLQVFFVVRHQPCWHEVTSLVLLTWNDLPCLSKWPYQYVLWRITKQTWLLRSTCSSSWGSSCKSHDLLFVQNHDQILWITCFVFRFLYFSFCLK